MNKNSKSGVQPTLQLKRRYFIESSRHLPHLPKSHPCSRVHGHSFRIELSLRGPLDPKRGWVMDYAEIDSRVNKILSLIDHRSLNEVRGLENPTTENLCLWIFAKVRQEFARTSTRAGALIQVERVQIRETRDSECSYP